MITSQELHAMFGLGFEIECEFVIDDGSFAVHMRGHYTPNELKMMLEAVELANTVFAQCPRTAEARAALIAKNERNAELKALQGDLDRSGYTVRIVGDTLEVRDPVQCSSGSKSWIEYKDVVLKNEKDVYHFLDARS